MNKMDRRTRSKLPLQCAPLDRVCARSTRRLALCAGLLPLCAGLLTPHVRQRLWQSGLALCAGLLTPHLRRHLWQSGRTVFAITAVWLLAVGVRGGEWIPVPSFEDHPLPATEVPAVSDSIRPAVDIGALVLALGLATWFALVTRSRRQLLVLTVASLLWFGFYRQGCICPVGATQNVVLASCDPTYVIPLVAVVFFLLPLVFTLLFGRTFCAAVCPLGAVQELVALRSLRVPRWLDEALGLVPYFYLGAAIIFAASGTAFLICRYDPFVAFFRLGGNTNMLIFGSSLLLVGLVIGRPYCRYLCPYGALLRMLGAVSKWRVSITPSECLDCRLCEDVCPYGAIRPPTVPEEPAVRVWRRRRLATVMLLAPWLVPLGGWLGIGLAVPLSLWHPVVTLAEQVRRENLGLTTETTDASEAFRQGGESTDALFAAAIGMRRRFRWLGAGLGAWIGLVVGVKLVQLCLRQRRVGFHPDRSACVACGRCYWYCPVEKVRRGLIEDVSAVVGLHVAGTASQLVEIEA